MQIENEFVCCRSTLNKNWRSNLRHPSEIVIHERLVNLPKGLVVAVKRITHEDVMSSENGKWQCLITEFPVDFSFNGKLLHLFSLALSEFDKLSAGKWTLDNYEIMVQINEDESYAAIAFLPDSAYIINGIPFEIADRGMYKNGMGVNYIYCLDDFVLVNTTYMR